jgi:hypothetical protein
VYALVRVVCGVWCVLQLSNRLPAFLQVLFKCSST